MRKLLPVCGINACRRARAFSLSATALLSTNVMPCANAGRFPSIISLANSATERLHLLPALSLGLTEGAFFTPLVICSAFLAIMLYRYTLEGN